MKAVGALMRRDVTKPGPRRAPALLMAALWIGAAGPAAQPSEGPTQLLPPQAAGGGLPTMTLKFGWQAPPGAVPATMSFTPGSHDFSGFRLVLNGQAATPQAALEAIGRNNALLLSQIGPQDRLSSGRLRIVLPDHDRLRPLVAQQLRQQVPGILEFRAEEVRLDLHLFADTVARARLFDATEIVEQNDTLHPDAGHANAVLIYVVNQVTQGDTQKWAGRWLAALGGRGGATPVNVDPGTTVGPPRLLSFVASLRAALGAPAAGGNPATAAATDAATRRMVANGTGIVVDAQGHLLTNAHVTGTCGDLRFTDPEGNRGVLGLVAADAANDLALLRAERRWTVWARFRDSRAFQPGESVVTAGFPLSGLVSPEMAVTTGSVTTLAGLRGDTRQFQFSAPIQPGNSGGPVLDEQGRVIGVASSELNGLAMAAATGGAVPQNVNFAIKTDIARAFLASTLILLSEASGGAPMNAASIGELALKFTVRVECWK